MIKKKSIVRNSSTVMKKSIVRKRSIVIKRKIVKRGMMKKWNSLMKNIAVTKRKILVAHTATSMMSMKHKTLRIQSLKVLKKARTKVNKAALKETCKVIVKAFMRRVKIVLKGTLLMKERKAH